MVGGDTDPDRGRDGVHVDVVLGASETQLWVVSVKLREIHLSKTPNVEFRQGRELDGLSIGD